MEIKKLSNEPVFPYEYSVCTLVTRPDEYREMVDSFLKAGFDPGITEFIQADNTIKNEFDSFLAFNRFLREAKGRYIIVCHQDILVEHDNEAILRKRIDDINDLDPRWGVLGNAGARNLYKMSMVITENGKYYRTGTLPAKVISLDENFLVIKAEANIAVSSDLHGYHLYGTDICLIAECLGWSGYVIDFNITHKSSGKMDPSFYRISGELQKKYNRFFRGRYIKTTITRFYLGSSAPVSAFMNMGLVKSIVRLYYKILSGSRR